MNKFKKFTRLSTTSLLSAVLFFAVMQTGCGGNNDTSTITPSVTGDSVSGGPMSGKPDGEPPSGGMPGAEHNATAANISYSAIKEINENIDIKDDSIISTGTDENTILVSKSGVTCNIENSSLNRNSANSTGGDNASFYGVGAVSLVKDGTLKINKSNITSDAKGGAGVFSYGNGEAYVSSTNINCNKDTSGGIHVAGGGKLYAWNVNAVTNGESSAAIRSDRGSGVMRVDGGTFTSNGTGSPAIYSTADIAVNGATLTSNSSEAICVEGKNSVRLFNCNLSGYMPSDNSQNDCVWNVILYQSMSGDSTEGNSTFEMQGGHLTAKAGGMFYTTNTESTFVIRNVSLYNSSDNPFLLKCTGNSNQRGWGSSGSNGATSSFFAYQQNMTGDVVWDTISKLDFYMAEGSTLTGAFVNDETHAGGGGAGYASLNISADSTWVVTKSSVLTNLHNLGNIVFFQGKTVTIVAGGSTVVNGDSDILVTVAENYDNVIDTSKMVSTTAWTDYKVDNPFE